MDDETLLRRVIDLAASARRDGEAPFASLLAAPDGSVLAEDHSTARSTGDETAHPELKLAMWAARELTPAEAADVTMFTSCQPCAMCTGVIDRVGLRRVVFALSSEQLGAIAPQPVRRPVPLDGPYLHDEIRAAIGDHYTAS
ncbi:nucleoside deaminase [Aeromicrobium sp. CFBP 8757]|uniref:nucleoside deaminase n=1 Tax=Aeromicrobium sp. CFBP 8757 TaxID=2775288 RepID=UPI001784E459|nr:nucleoside deaminase [Aeromicrobium sp. CFBP 8757]MBD8606339.1 nucleoside deaminase [Aeromicrobium sp. CFBP 8757]